MKDIFPFLIIAISVTLFFTTNQFFDGYLKSPTSLGREIQSNKDSLYHFNITSKAPFKFRVLFPMIVSSSYHLVAKKDDTELFYNVYKFWSALFYVLSTLVFFYLLRTLNFTESWSFFGTMIFLFMPAMMLAFTVPVHTREDTLAYLIFFLGLIFISKEKFWQLLFLSVIGAFCRETLLLLPLLYFLFSTDTLFKRGVVLAIPIVLWLLFRYLNKESYDYLEGLRWNMANPIQVIGFLFIAFGFQWLPLVHAVFNRNFSFRANDRTSFFYKSSVLVFFMILVSTFLGGIFNEIRLLYLLAPWMVIFTLNYFLRNLKTLRTQLSIHNYQIYIFVVFGIILYLLLWSPFNLQEVVKPGKFKVPYSVWLNVFLIHAAMVVAMLPFFLKNPFQTKNR
jgi:hypothetical protein